MNSTSGAPSALRPWSVANAQTVAGEPSRQQRQEPGDGGSGAEPVVAVLGEPGHGLPAEHAVESVGEVVDHA